VPIGTTIYTIWFDDNSNFTDRSTTISGNDNISQIVWGAEPVWIVQQKALQNLSAAVYNETKEYHDFKIRILDGSSTIFEYGQIPPTSETITTASKPVFYQKPNADIGLGELRIEVWN
jgi:hypothetical protein